MYRVFARLSTSVFYYLLIFCWFNVLAPRLKGILRHFPTLLTPEKLSKHPLTYVNARRRIYLWTTIYISVHTALNWDQRMNWQVLHSSYIRMTQILFVLNFYQTNLTNVIFKIKKMNSWYLLLTKTYFFVCFTLKLFLHKVTKSRHWRLPKIKPHWQQSLSWIALINTCVLCMYGHNVYEKGNFH